MQPGATQCSQPAVGVAATMVRMARAAASLAGRWLMTLMLLTCCGLTSASDGTPSPRSRQLEPRTALLTCGADEHGVGARCSGSVALVAETNTNSSLAGGRHLLSHVGVFP